jgi:hypothetical protein
MGKQFAKIDNTSSQKLALHTLRLLEGSIPVKCQNP